MTGRLQGVATRFEQVAKPGFFRLWCGLHQLDIVLQHFFLKLMTDTFYGQLTALISYLRRQQNLISEMRTKAPKVADTRWESMSKVSIRIGLVCIANYVCFLRLQIGSGRTGLKFVHILMTKNQSVRLLQHGG